MNRLDCFNVAAAAILHRLLGAFPQPVVLDSRHLQAELAAQHPDCAIEGGPGNPGNLVRWTIQFLVDEGYVRAAGSVGPATGGCVLTAKGFSALNRKLESLTPETTLASRLLEAGKLCAPEVAGTILSRFLTP